MGLFSLANLYGMTIRESANDGSDFTNPDADYRRLFLGEDGLLHVKDSAGTVTSPYTGAGLTVEDEGTPLATAATTLDFVGAGVTASGTGAEKTITIGATPPDCYQSIMTAPVTIVSANTFYDAVSITPPAGVYLVTFEADVSSVHASGSNITWRIIHNSVVQKARNELGPGSTNPVMGTVTVRMTADGSNPIIGQCADNRASSDATILDTALVNGTTDKCTSITAIRVTSA